MGLTLFLGLYAFILTMVLGIGLGVLTPVRKRRGSDRAIEGLSVVGVSTPPFVSAVILLYVFAVRATGFRRSEPGPACLGCGSYTSTLRGRARTYWNGACRKADAQASMIVALEQDYVTFARARGVPYGRVSAAYAFRNALIPIVTAAGTVLGFMLTGAVLVEVAFALPGVGSLLVDSVTFSDVPMIQGVAMAAGLADHPGGSIDRHRVCIGGPAHPIRECPRVTSFAGDRISQLRRSRYRVPRPRCCCCDSNRRAGVRPGRSRDCAARSERPKTSSSAPLGPAICTGWELTLLAGMCFHDSSSDHAAHSLDLHFIAVGAMVFGNALGLFAGYLGGVTDAAIMRWVDLMYALPGLLVAIVVLGTIGGGYWIAVVVLVVLTIPYDTRLIRGATLEQRSLLTLKRRGRSACRERECVFRHIWLEPSANRRS